MNPGYWVAFNPEICIRKWGYSDGNVFRCMITLGGEDSRQFQIGLGFIWFSLWLTFPYLLPKKWAIGWKEGNPHRFEDSHGRDFGAYLSDNHLMFKFFSSNMGSSTRPNFRKWGWSWSCFIDEMVFGRRNMTEVQTELYPHTPISFSEGVYHLNIKLTHDTWRYSRWPWWPLNRMVPRAKISVEEPGGIPVPGKGENSWDCGDDAIHGLCCSASDWYAAKEAVKQSVIRTRSRYGSGEAMYLKRKKEVQHEE